MHCSNPAYKRMLSDSDTWVKISIQDRVQAPFADEVFEAAFQAMDQVYDRMKHQPAAEILRISQLLEQLTHGLFSVKNHFKEMVRGFAIDQAVNTIQSIDPELSGCINAVGDLSIFGPKSQTVHVRVNSLDGAPFLSPIELKNQSISTGQVQSINQYYHPLKHMFQNEPLTVSVVAPTRMIADALTKIALLGELDDQASHSLLNFFGAKAIQWKVQPNEIEIPT